jgi:AraC family transcriptional regulator of adaptative response / DNA-3-methyladenine glycosylase II
MQLDATRCYRALRSRDRRFDGRFFVAVKTTGIYCRPICPARTPKLGNIHFFPCAAAAEEAGFRPCLRCRPETAPGTPAWNGTPAVVERALRLLGRGALDEAGVDALAERLGMGSRHLRRLFRRYLGAGPLAVARTERLHFARRLIDETDLPVTRIALASGFGSVRQFNHAFSKTFRQPPTALRRRPAAARGTPDGYSLRLAFRAPFDWGALLAFHAARAIPGVEAVEDGTYRRTIVLGEASGTLRVSAEPRALRVDVALPATDRLFEVAARVRRMFDLDADPERIAAELRRDALLASRFRRRPGLRLPGAWDPFECAVRAIVGQQVTVRAATTIAGRIAEAFGRPLADGGGPVRIVFPDARALREAPLERAGVIAARAEAIRALAATVADGTLALDGTLATEDAVDRLRALPGIGDWTAQYIALRALGEPDAFPAGDLGLRKAAGNGAGPLSEQALLARAEAWRPWRGYAALHLWTEGGPRR